MKRQVLVDDYDIPVLYTTDEVAAILKVSRNLVTRKAREGTLPSTRIGEKLYRFRHVDIMEYLQKSTRIMK